MFQMANSTKCPATTKISCGKMEHFAKVCHSGQKHEVSEAIIPELTANKMQSGIRHITKYAATSYDGGYWIVNFNFASLCL